MDLLAGLKYSVRGLRFALGDAKLLFWGMVRFAVVILITVILASLIFVYHQQILDLMWAKPESAWVIWLWYLVSWLISLLLLGVAVVFSYLISQILFSVIIMDHMSRLTERKVTGHVKEPERMPFWRQFIFLVKQEIPRTFIPVVLSLLIMILSWFVLLGPLMVVLSSAIAIVFLAWDNTDLTPARRLIPFGDRFRFLSRSILFHVGFGLPYLVPLLNILFLSFSPVGATLYYLDIHDAERAKKAVRS
jgi:CysZ protein